MRLHNILVAVFVFTVSTVSRSLTHPDHFVAFSGRELIDQDLEASHGSQFRLFTRQASSKKDDPDRKYDALKEYNSLKSVLQKLGKPMPENGQMVWLRQQESDLHRRLIGCRVQPNSVLCKNFELWKDAPTMFHPGGLIGTRSKQRNQADPAWILDVEQPYKFMGETKEYEWLDIRAAGDKVMDNYGRTYNAFTKNCHGFCRILFQGLITNTGIEGAAATRVATTSSAVGAAATSPHHTETAAEIPQAENNQMSVQGYHDSESNLHTPQQAEHDGNSGNPLLPQPHPSGGVMDLNSPQVHQLEGATYQAPSQGYQDHGAPSQSHPQEQNTAGSPDRARSQPHYNAAAASRRSSQIHHKRAKILESVIDELIERSLENDLLFADLETELWARGLDEL